MEGKGMQVLRREESNGLPKGVNRELSPLFNFVDNPVLLLGYAIRYAHIVQAISAITDFGKVPDQRIRILDVGCGNGELFRWLQCSWKAKGTKLLYAGIDMDPWKIENAKRIFKRHAKDFHLEDVLQREKLPKCEVAICSEVLEHMPKEQARKLLKMMAKSCKYLIGTVPAPCRRKNPFHVCEYTGDEIKEELEKAGFNIEFLGWLDAKFDVKEAGRFMSKAVYKQYQGMKGTDRVKGVDSFFVARSRRRNFQLLSNIGKRI